MKSNYNYASTNFLVLTIKRSVNIPLHFLLKLRNNMTNIHVLNSVNSYCLLYMYIHVNLTYVFLALCQPSQITSLTTISILHFNFRCFTNPMFTALCTCICILLIRYILYNHDAFCHLKTYNFL